VKIYLKRGRLGTGRGWTTDLADANQFLHHQPVGRKVFVIEAEELTFDPTMAPPVHAQDFESLHVNGEEEEDIENLGTDEK